MSVPMTVYSGKEKDQTELVYRFEEDVFNPNDTHDHNLAAMIGAQVALNYGIFCKKIVFHGVLDHQDRRFIRDMMENTSREIYVKKLLEENPFIKTDWLPVLAERHKKYTQADVIFDQNDLATAKMTWSLWSTSRSKHAVLSSGGKDSLLSFGLLSEIGKEVHPVFINESGRHWFTAINSYRHFKDTLPNTARVWTNADRVFSWMLRHLPFIRENFASVRADIYPLRLWTVAVFLFGALPVIRKRGIGRLIIGDEYDTTIRTGYKGITHYDGLHDQSRYFDSALSRYFLAKGWSVAQFSILRPLSELLIMKVLSERYPLLQQQQVSCHAAHLENERVHPCGKCEKCRRIVGMLTALGGDPRNCGYKTAQIDESIKSLVEKGVHQESAGQQQMLSMLKHKGLISSVHRIAEHTETLHLRFDPDKSPLDGIPYDLRIPIYKIVLTHALGAVRRIGRKWTPFNVLEDPQIHKTYAFEASEYKMVDGASGGKRGRKYILGELTWPEAEAYLKIVDVAILPVGAIEQHGPHLPLDTDAYDADYLAKQVAAACSYPKPLVLPLVSYGVSYHHDDFKGTISINNNTLSQLIYEIGMSTAQNGITKLIILNGHGGNGPSLNFAAQMINRDSKIFVAVDSGETSDVDVYGMVETPNDVHAGEFETSTSLAIRKHLVKMNLAKKSIPQFSSRYLNFTSQRGISWYAYTKKISENGVMGDPTKATAEKGEKMWQMMIAHLVALVEDLKRLSLDEIHQRRY
ncbi:MAG: creatininase family protein [Calditrichales bacterium]|nr:MAG: creatininase family protein [Calditrichales bacterium]